MDIYTATEEAYKKGREDAINTIAAEVYPYFDCRSCLAREMSDSEKSCEITIAAWMLGLFEEVE